MPALNFPVSPNHLDQYTDPNQAVWQYDSDGPFWNVITNTTRKNFSGAKRKIGSDFDVTSTLRKVDFTTEEYSIDNYFGGTNNRVTVPTTGFYRVFASLYTSSGGSGSSYTVELRKNGIKLFDVKMGANQNVNFDETLSLVAGDYLEVWGSEESSVGQFTTDSEFVVYRIGFAPGTGISNHSAFSGARAILLGSVNSTNVATAIDWGGTEFNANANVNGDLYWYSAQTSRLTVLADGFYKIRSFVKTTSAGGKNSYTITIRKNGSTNLDSITMGPNDQLDFDEVIQLAQDDYIELLISNSDNTGGVTSDTYLEIVREGV